MPVTSARRAIERHPRPCGGSSSRARAARRRRTSSTRCASRRSRSSLSAATRASTTSSSRRPRRRRTGEPARLVARPGRRLGSVLVGDARPRDRRLHGQRDAPGGRVRVPEPLARGRARHVGGEAAPRVRLRPPDAERPELQPLGRTNRPPRGRQRAGDAGRPGRRPARDRRLLRRSEGGRGRQPAGDRDQRRPLLHDEQLPRRGGGEHAVRVRPHGARRTAGRAGPLRRRRARPLLDTHDRHGVQAGARRRMAQQAGRPLALFDFDGTLCRLETDYAALRAQLEELGGNGDGLLELMLALDDDPRARELVTQAELAGLERGSDVEAGVQLYKAFAEEDTAVAVVSHNGHAVIEAFLRDRGLPEPDAILDRRALRGPKEKSDAVAEYAAGSDPVYVIGDSDSDRRLAAKLGASFLDVGDPLRSYYEKRAHELDELALTYEHPSPYKRFFYAARFGAVLGALDPQRDERILELGCGSGSYTRELVQAGARVAG